MNDQELEKRLKSSVPPERSDGYWQGFPQSVARSIRAGRRPMTEPPSLEGSALRMWWPRFALAAVVVTVLMVVLAPRFRQSAGLDGQLVDLRTYYHQVADMFPGQFQAVVLSPDAVQLQLSEDANVPVSPPIYVRICGPASRCTTVVTFSGQTIHVGGRDFEVLADGQGDIILLAKEWVWSSGNAPVAGRGWRIESGWLEL